MHRLPLTAAILCVLWGAERGATQTSLPADAMQVRQAFDAHVPHPPTVATIGNVRRLFYELHLTNFATVPLRLLTITVVDDGTGRVLRQVQGAALDPIIGGPGVVELGELRRTVGTGRRTVIYIELILDDVAPVRLRHRIDFDIQSKNRSSASAIVGAVTLIRVAKPLILGPPLSGGPWVAIYDPALENGHRRYVYAVGGKARIPGRFAIDWMRACAPEGASAGAPVLAVADAVVVATRDDVAEIVPSMPDPPLTLGDATGNYVALDLGNERYAFYEHLAPGLSVKLGDPVRRGQVIGRIGSTGQASRPHLHFHMADANAPLAAEGQPYLLTGARVVGAYRSIAAFEAGEPWQPKASLEGAPTMPPPNSVIIFQNAASARSSSKLVLSKTRQGNLESRIFSPAVASPQKADDVF